MMDPVTTGFVQLGEVTAPSGVLVLGVAGWIDYWSVIGAPLPERAATAADRGGGHLRDYECEAVAVSAASDRPLTVSASTSPSPFDGAPTIATLRVDVGWPWSANDDSPMPLGDLPVDRCGMVLGDATGFDSWSGLGGTSIDGLADVVYWGGLAERARLVFGGDDLAPVGRRGCFGWLDLPVQEAERRVEQIRVWEGDNQGRGVMVAVDEHTHHYLVQRAGWSHPLHAAAIEAAGCRMLGIAWDQGDHAMRHRGERRAGQVYPVTLERSISGGTLLCWTIPPLSEHEGRSQLGS